VISIPWVKSVHENGPITPLKANVGQPPNPSIERTSPGEPVAAAHVER